MFERSFWVASSCILSFSMACSCSTQLRTSFDDRQSHPSGVGNLYNAHLFDAQECLDLLLQVSSLRLMRSE